MRLRFNNLTVKRSVGGRYPGLYYNPKQRGPWYFRVLANGGEFQVNPYQVVPPEAWEELFALERNPLSAIKAYGLATCSCSMCGRELTDPRSTEVGYGPVCAERWGLPWGNP